MCIRWLINGFKMLDSFSNYSYRQGKRVFFCFRIMCVCILEYIVENRTSAYGQTARLDFSGYLIRSDVSTKFSCEHLVLTLGLDT